MGILSKASKLSFGVLLLLITICLVGMYVVQHNQIAELQGKTPWLAAILAIAGIGIAIVNFQLLSTQSNCIKQKEAQLDELRNVIQQSKSDEVIEQEKKEMVEEVMDLEKEIADLLPNDSFNSEEQFLESLLSNIGSKHNIVQAVAFSRGSDNATFSMVASYAYFSEGQPITFTEGETLAGQVVKNRLPLCLTEVPHDYITVLSGLGKGTPSNLLILPVLGEANSCNTVIELAAFKPFDEQKVKLFQALSSTLGERLNRIGNSTIE